MKKGNGERNNEEAKERRGRGRNARARCCAVVVGGADEETKRGVIEHTIARVVAG